MMSKASRKTTSNKKPVLSGLCLEELSAVLSDYPAFRARQIHRWICSGVKSFEAMNNVPLSLRKELSEKYELYPFTLVTSQKDSDGTEKIGIALEDGNVIEAVLLQDGKGRLTACLSTQAGCPAACVFCKTGSLGFKRNLCASEIAGQFLLLKSYREQDTKEKEISHIVIMGMGEPLLNLEELRKALLFFSESEGLNISKRRITISTCGIEKGIIDLTEKGPDVRLALSLTTAIEELRGRLMPLTKGSSLSSIRQALIYYQQKRKRRLTLEVVLLKGINTSQRDAEAIAKFIKTEPELDAVVNLIPWNSVDGLMFEERPLCAPSPKELARFAETLESLHITVTRRFKKGTQISGACGQLGVVV
ncbi:MAG: 23S rRNA (adenine(2503)-C(2))-methyltransferase RlmN [Treponema sp.]|jgi:23S rRNA (adenine2503-C2)-methyltransferase|nr:23S rRNA (adenine(2503)-C(2))-methyltransferase RlmN [Treponema sp.]